MNDNPEMPGSTPEEQDEAEAHAQFSKLADLARKAMEDRIAALMSGAHAPLLDVYDSQFAVLCGTVAAVVTSMVGIGDAAGDDIAGQAALLNTLVGQAAGVFNEIQQRKALLAATDQATAQ